jgi:hypothetical protein
MEFLVPNYLRLSFILPPFWLGIHKKISYSSCVSYNFWPFIVGWFLNIITSIARLLRSNPIINLFIDNLPIDYWFFDNQVDGLPINY